MRIFKFDRKKYGKDLLIDCLSIKQLSKLNPVLKELHTTSFYEVYFFSHVEGELSVEGHIYKMNGSNIVLLPPLLSRQWDISFKEDSYVVIFDEEIFGNILNDPRFLYRLRFFGCENPQPVMPIKQNSCGKYGTILNNIRSEISNLEIDSPYLLSAYLYQLLLEINRDYSDYFKLDRGLNMESDIIRFRNLLKKHISSKQTVKAYAELMGISRNSLNSMSMKTYGENANLIIKNELHSSCKNELLFSKYTIAEIAHKYNFSAPSNFTRFFKSNEGISPTEYRKKIKT